MKNLEDASRVFLKRLVKGPGCWFLTTATSTRGYSIVQPKSGRQYGHRVAYELYVGPIPEGLVLDHLCRNRACVNPDHLEPVTSRENVLRGAGSTIRTYHTNVCQRGHLLVGSNEYIRPDNGRRMCRECTRLARQRRTARERLLNEPACAAYGDALAVLGVTQ